MNEAVAKHIMRNIRCELAGLYVGGYIRNTHSILPIRGRLIIRTVDGHFVEVGAREISPDDPAVSEFRLPASE